MHCGVNYLRAVTRVDLFLTKPTLMYGEPETGDVIHLHKAIEHFDNLYIRSAASTEEKIKC